MIAAAAIAALALQAGAAPLPPVVTRTRGQPYAALATSDGARLLVTETMPRSALRPDEAASAPPGAGRVGAIEVFRIDPGGALVSERVTPLGPTVAQGIAAVPGTPALVVGMSGGGLRIANMQSVIDGRASGSAVPLGEDAGSGAVAVTADGRTAFVADEYGGQGNVAPVRFTIEGGRVTGAEVRALIPTPIATPGLALSPDGSRLYVAAEIAPDAEARAPGWRDGRLGRSRCVQQAGGPARLNGLVYVVDTGKLAAARDGAEARASVIARVASGCSPVRIAVSRNGTQVYVTARGDDRVLQFDARALEADPDHALVRALPSGGAAPVGLALFAGDTKLLVADSDRFGFGHGALAVIDLASGRVERKLPALGFPRTVSPSSDGRTLYVTNFNGKAIQAVPAL